MCEFKLFFHNQCLYSGLIVRVFQFFKIYIFCEKLLQPGSVSSKQRTLLWSERSRKIERRSFLSLLKIRPLQSKISSKTPLQSKISSKTTLKSKISSKTTIQRKSTYPMKLIQSEELSIYHKPLTNKDFELSNSKLQNTTSLVKKYQSLTRINNFIEKFYTCSMKCVVVTCFKDCLSSHL